MNIIIYADDFYQDYKRGIANYGFNLIKALKENNHKVYIYSRGESDLRKKQLNNLSYRIAFANELIELWFENKIVITTSVVCCCIGNVTDCDDLSRK